MTFSSSTGYGMGKGMEKWSAGELIRTVCWENGGEDRPQSSTSKLRGGRMRTRNGLNLKRKNGEIQLAVVVKSTRSLPVASALFSW